MILTRYDGIEAYVTRDGSLIRELLHPALHDNVHQSLAEAEIAPGVTTRLHRHIRSEELYHITAGRGLMTLDAEQFAVVVGDTICIPPGAAHCICNTGAEILRILCCCAPPYAHEDTVLVEVP